MHHDRDRLGVVFHRAAAGFPGLDQVIGHLVQALEAAVGGGFAHGLDLVLDDAAVAGQPVDQPAQLVGHQPERPEQHRAGEGGHDDDGGHAAQAQALKLHHQGAEQKRQEDRQRERDHDHAGPVQERQQGPGGHSRAEHLQRALAGAAIQGIGHDFTPVRRAWAKGVGGNPARVARASLK